MTASKQHFVGQIIPQHGSPQNVEFIAKERPNITSAERAAGVQWVDSRYNEGEVLRYGENTEPGTTDMTTAIQAAFNSIGDGQSVVFPDNETLLISSNISITGINDIVVKGNNATISENGITLTGHIALTNCDRAKIRDLNFSATETHGSFVSGTPSDERSFIDLTTCDDVVIENVHGVNKRRLITADTCPRLRVSGFSFVGFFQDTGSGIQSDANHSPCVTVIGCDDSVIESGRVYNHGSAVLGQSTSERVSISGIVGQDLHDNGVYLSSGEACVVRGCSFNGAGSDGVKTRGNNNSVLNCSVNDAGISSGGGIAVEGLNVAVVNNSGGYGAVVMGNTVTNSNVGIRAGVNNSLYLRDVVVMGNTVINCSVTGQTGAIHLLVNQGLTCTGNIVRTFAGDFGILAACQRSDALSDTFVDGDVTTGTDRITMTAHPFTDGDPVTLTTDGAVPAGLAVLTPYWVNSVDANTVELYSDPDLSSIVDITAAAGGGTHTITHMPGANINISNNTIEDGNGSSSATRGGIRVQYVSSGVSVNGNIFRSIACNIGVRLLECHTGTVIGNVFVGEQVVRVPSAEGNTGIFVLGNKGSTITVDGQTNNLVGTNDASITGSQLYTLNATAVLDRTLLASASATTLNNNNVLAALISDLQAQGIIQ